MGLRSGLAKRSYFCTRKILPWACQMGVFQSSMRCSFSTWICKSACIHFIFSGRDAPSVLGCIQIGSKKAPKRGKWVVCSSRFACNPAQKEHLLLKRWIECTQIYKLRLKNCASSMIEKRPSGMHWAVFFEYKKTFVFPVLSGFPSIAPILMRFQRINMMFVFLFNGLMRPLLPTLL